MLSVDVTRAGGADWERLGSVIGSAFSEDAVNLWVFRETSNIVLTFGQLARHVYLPRGACFLAGEYGGAMWLSPGQSSDFPFLPTLMAATKAIMRRDVQPILRALRVAAAMERRHPKEPHYYLFAVGVQKEARGRGVARQLLTPVLERCDIDGIPAYLENSSPKNTSFYKSLGFVARECFVPAPGCPELMPMWREPQDPGRAA